MNNPKVSIVMPCYNGADTIERAIRGVLNQTYRPIQFILVNDGSTDNTNQVVESLKTDIENSGIEFLYHCQNNLGLGGAINTGLKFVDGEYLAWIDADDELLPESVKIRAEFLKNNHDYGSVSSNAVMAEDCDWEKSLGTVTNDIERNSEENQFMHMLMGRSVFCCGCHLVRTEVFKKANGGMDINPFRYGQNWQMLLPVYYSSKHMFIDEPLYKYRVNAQNMTAKVNNLPLQLIYKRRCGYIKNVFITLSKIQNMSKDECDKYKRMFRKSIYEGNLDIALQHNSKTSILFWKIMVKLQILKNNYFFK